SVGAPSGAEREQRAATTGSRGARFVAPTADVRSEHRLGSRRTVQVDLPPDRPRRGRRSTDMQGTRRVALAIAGVAAVAVGLAGCDQAPSTVHRVIDPVVLTG